MVQTLDLGGNDLVVNSITTGVNVSGKLSTGANSLPGNQAFTVGSTIKSNVVALTFTGNVASGSSYFVQGTTPALATAAATSQTEVYTLTGVAAADIAFVSLVGGTNTTQGLQLSAVCTTNTVTVTIYNNNVAAAALNGTVIFNLWILKA